jgi:hypothetical protein
MIEFRKASLPRMRPRLRQLREAVQDRDALLSQRRAMAFLCMLASSYATGTVVAVMGDS